MVLMGQYCENV